METTPTEEPEADERRIRALRKALRLHAEASRRSVRAESPEDREAAETQADVIENVLRAMTTGE